MKKAVLFAIIFICVLRSPAQVGVWVEKATPTTDWLLDVQFVDADYGYAVGDLGTVLRSTDGGLHWDSLPSPADNTLNAVCFVDRNTGWAGGNGTGILFHTTDAGQNWTRQDSGNSVTDMEFVSATTGWAVTFAGTVLKTTDGGGTWISQTVPDPFVYFTSVHFIGSDTGWISGKYPGTVLNTTDGGTTWTEMTAGLSADDDYNELCFIDGSTGWLAGAGFDTSFNFFGLIKKTTDGGQSWTEQFSLPDIDFLSVGFMNDLDGFVTGIEGYLFRTTDGGANWSGEYTGVNRELSKVFVRGSEGGWIVGPEGMVLRNDFGGLVSEHQVAMNANWNMISLPCITPEVRKDSLFPTALSNMFYFDNGYTATDTARNGVGYWLKFSSSQSVTVLGRPLDSLTVALRAGWNLIGGIATDMPVGSISVASPTAVLSSFFRFDSNGYQSTTVLSPGLGFWVKSSEATEITMLATSSGKSRPAGTLINAAMLSSDELPPPPPCTPAAAGDAAASAVPASYRLEQNYPNPFNPSTTLRFDLPENSAVTLLVFDALGRTVDEILSGLGLPAGTHEVTWEPGVAAPAVISSGLYFYRIEAISDVTGKIHRDVKKMTYVK